MAHLRVGATVGVGLGLGGMGGEEAILVHDPIGS